MKDTVSHHKSVFRRYPRISIIFLMVILILTSLVLAEWILAHKTRTFVFEAAGEPRVIILREYPPKLNFSMTRANLEAESYDENGQKNQAQIRVSADGFVEPSGLHENADASIIFLGGSSTECLWMDEEIRFPYLSGKLMEEKTGEKINTYNGGFSGNDLRHSVNALWNKCLALNPDYVVVMHNVNDLTFLKNMGSYWNNEQRSHLMNVDDIDGHAHFSMIQRFSTGWFPYLTTRINQFFLKNRSNDEWSAVRDQVTGLDSINIFNEYEMALRSFISICQNWDITPVLMVQPNLITDVPLGTYAFTNEFDISYRNQGFTYEEFQRLYTRMNELNRQLADEYKIPLIDLDQWLPKQAENFYDRIHLTERGSEQVSQIISDSFAVWLGNSSHQ